MKGPLERMINRATRRAVRKEKHRLLKLGVKALLVAAIVSSVSGKQNDAVAMEFKSTASIIASDAAYSAVEAVSEAKDALVEKIKSVVPWLDYSTEDGAQEAAEAVYDAASEFADENGLVFSRASLTRVVDGDTIVVDIYGDDCGEASHQYSVRLIGVNTPESVASEEYLERKGTTNSEEGKAASDYTKEVLEGVKDLYLQTDTSDTDRYGRLLRYVWLEVPSNAYDIDEVTNKMLNGVLVRDGYAECAVYKPDTMYADYFEAIEIGKTDDFEVDR